jgi:chromosome partitioning protein
MIILVGGEKGGTGKTTVITNLASMRIEKTKDVLLIDTDKQGSASAWASVRDQNQSVNRIISVQKFGNTIGNEIRALNIKYDDILIDAGGQNSQELRASMIVADKMYVPIQAGQFDVWTLGLMDQLVSQARSLNPNLEAKVLINRASTNPSTTEIEEIFQVMSEFENLSLSSAIIKERIAYRKAAKEGLSVVELAKQDPKASDEVLLLYNEIYDMI